MTPKEKGDSVQMAKQKLRRIARNSIPQEILLHLCDGRWECLTGDERFKVLLALACIDASIKEGPNWMLMSTRLDCHVPDQRTFTAIFKPVDSRTKRLKKWNMNEIVSDDEAERFRLMIPMYYSSDSIYLCCVKLIRDREARKAEIDRLKAEVAKLNELLEIKFGD